MILFKKKKQTEKQIKVRTEMCSNLYTESLLNKLEHLLELTKTVAFHVTQAKAILVWAQL